MAIRRLTTIFAMLFSVLILSACGTQESIGTVEDVDAIDSFDFRIESGEARLAVVFPTLQIDAGARIPLASLGQSYIEISPDFQSGGLLFVISISIRSLFAGHDLPEWGLMDGRYIPGVTNGVLPGMLSNLPVFGTSLLYLGKDIFGLFLPIDFGSFSIQITIPMRDAMGNLLGVITAVPNSGSDSISGALFLFPIEGSNSADELSGSLR